MPEIPLAHQFLPLLAILAAALVACGGAPAPTTTPTPTPTPPSPPTPAPTPIVLAPAASDGNPCFDGAPPLVAGDLHRQLEKHTWSWSMSDDEQPPPEPFGTCTVHRGEVRAADGTLIATLGCGVQIHARGVVDDLGIELGARGADLLARWTAPHGPMVCLGNGPDQTRCRFDRADEYDDTDFSAYVVAGALPGDVLTGADAERFFADREIVEIWYSVWCH